MSEGLQYAKKLAEEARASYLKLMAAAEAAVVRWEWATSDIRSHKPAYFELAKLTRGRALASRPTAGGSGARRYGIDRRELVVVERQLREFGFYDTFFVHEGEGIASYHYSYDPEKSWINVEWLVQGAPGIVEAHSVFARGQLAVRNA